MTAVSIEKGLFQWQNTGAVAVISYLGYLLLVLSLGYSVHFRVGHAQHGISAVAESASGASGKFWFDRAAVKTHLFGRTKESDEERANLWAFCEEESTRGV